MKKLKLKWSDGNSKLKKTKTIAFNLPAFKSKDGFKVCSQAGKCAGVCYALQGRYGQPNVQAPREFNLAIARENLDYFTGALISDLDHIKNKTVRIHDSGDFFSQAYLNAWKKAARAFPEKLFYAYTKSLHLDFSAMPKNFVIIQSVGGMLDHLIDVNKPHSRIFVSHEDREKAGYVDGNVDDRPAQRGEIKIGLVYHGNRNMTEKQKESFAV